MSETKKFNVEALSDKELEQATAEAKKRKQRYNWSGAEGIYRSARAIPLAVHKSNSDNKRQLLKEQLEQFIAERLD